MEDSSGNGEAGLEKRPALGEGDSCQASLASSAWILGWLSLSGYASSPWVLVVYSGARTFSLLLLRHSRKLRLIGKDLRFRSCLFYCFLLLGVPYVLRLYEGHNRVCSNNGKSHDSIYELLHAVGVVGL